MNDWDIVKMITKISPTLNLPIRSVVILEIIVFLVASLLADQIFFEGDRFIHIEPHPFWIVVVLLSVQYGSLAGLLCAFACSAGFLVDNIPDRSFDQDRNEWIMSVIKLPFLWFLSAVVIGEVSARRLTEREELRNEIQGLNERESALLETLESLGKSKDRLEVLIAGQWNTVQKTLVAARDIESLTPELLLENSMVLIEHLLGPDQFSIYIFEDNTLTYAYGKGWENSFDYADKFGIENPLFTAIIGERRTLSISRPQDEQLLERQGVLAGPIINHDTGEIIGMLKVEKIPFTRFSMGALKNFDFLCDWIGSLYSKALKDRKFAND